MDGDGNFLEKIKSLYGKRDCEKITRAFEFSKKAHEGQKRAGGEDYFIHPRAVADILIDMKMDSATIIAALLHDVLEDTKVTDVQIAEEFGGEILTLVKGVTRFDKLKFADKIDEEAENLRKMFLSIAEDIRVIIIKLADRLHNMRTLEAKASESRKRKAMETLEIYAPFAGRLGMSQIKVELEDLCLLYLYPEAYAELKEKVSLKLAERQDFIAKVCGEIKARLVEMGIESEVYGRPKHFYSIFNKMRNQNKKFDEIYDLIAVRVIVDSVKDCYGALGVIHTMWPPMQGRFKDYIAMRKANNYQSLHTTVFSKFGALFEIQIRTKEMHEIAEYGIAAHWKYKNPKALGDSQFNERLNFIKGFIEADISLSDNEEFLDIVKADLGQHELLVFTPKGKIIDLPVGSNGIDFAYNIHSELGNKCVGIKINGEMARIDTKLQSGDVVEVLTNPNSKGPSRDWLKIVKTTSAKSKIHQFFKREMKDDNIKKGRDMLESEARHKGYVFSELLHGKGLDEVMKRYVFSSEDDMFASVGYGGITTKQILFKLVEAYKKEKKIEYKEKGAVSSNGEKREATGGIMIGGYNEENARYASCCNPLPGDEIVAYLSKGRGVAVHRSDCSNLKGLDAERLQKAEWPTVITHELIANIRVTVVDRKGVFSEVSSLISGMGFDMESFQGNITESDGSGIKRGDIRCSIKIKSMDELNAAVNRIRAMKDVIDAQRF
ncbi:MAG: bifunctional (p)ppGpp synthetase/guanosine-3',5'-bis(diphosphate) 3'-pyrophosphohydrolase [Clostridiales bacterium]|jgi:GTP pyrophosphokinase|nr:bifunctional (p)ppGpp synthetase/guanosine-3',5'-bis(diphosphate) 3'-pyrophosphohydrolase [Clostridiales bacterium]